MKSKIFLFIILYLNLVHAQNPALFDRTWILEKMVTQQGVDIFHPVNDELEEITAIFYQNDYMISEVVQSIICDGTFSGNPVTDNQLFYEEFAIGYNDCIYDVNCDFQSDYFEFFIYGMPMYYTIEEENNILRLTLESNSGIQAIYTYKLMSVNELEDDNSIIYPNPVKDILFINSKFNIQEVHIYDMQAKCVKTIKSQNQISMRDVPKGTYLIQIKTEKGVFSQKIIK